MGPSMDRLPAARIQTKSPSWKQKTQNLGHSAATHLSWVFFPSYYYSTLPLNFGDPRVCPFYFDQFITSIFLLGVLLIDHLNNVFGKGINVTTSLLDIIKINVRRFVIPHVASMLSANVRNEDYQNREQGVGRRVQERVSGPLFYRIEILATHSSMIQYCCIIPVMYQGSIEFTFSV